MDHGWPQETETAENKTTKKGQQLSSVPESTFSRYSDSDDCIFPPKCTNNFLLLQWFKKCQILLGTSCTSVLCWVENLQIPIFLFPGTEAAVNPAVGIHLPTQNPDLYHVSGFNTSGAPPPYEEIPKSSQL